MYSTERTLNQRIVGIDTSLPMTFDQLRVYYEDHRDAGALDELVVSHVELRRRAVDMYYVLAHIAATVPTDSQDRNIGYLVMHDAAPAHPSPPSDCLQSLLHSFSRSRTSRTPSAQVVDRDTFQRPSDDVCLRRHTFTQPCPLACVVTAGHSVGMTTPSPVHGKPRSSWFASLMYWLMVDEAKENDASMLGIAADSAVEPVSGMDQERCVMEHDFDRRTSAPGWRSEVEELEKLARGGRRMSKGKA